MNLKNIIFILFLASFTISELSSQIMYDIIPWRNKAPEMQELIKEKRLNAKVKSIMKIKTLDENGKKDNINVSYSEYDIFLNNTLIVFYDKSTNKPNYKQIKYYDPQNNEIASVDYIIESGQFILEDSTVNSNNKNNKVSFKNDTIYNEGKKKQPFVEVKFDSSGNLTEYIDSTPGIDVSKFYYSYYPDNNMKEKICMEGNQLLYRTEYLYNNNLLIETENHFDRNNNLKTTYKYIYEYYE